MYAADLTAVPAETRQAWTEFVKDNLPGLVRDLSPLERRRNTRGGRECYRDQRPVSRAGPRATGSPGGGRWVMDPRFIGPEGDIGRLGLALVLLHGRPDAGALKCAETLLEAMIDASRYENEMHRFGTGPAGQALAHRLLSQVAAAPVKAATTGSSTGSSSPTINI